ncbi:MAG: hypothetical protein CMB97_05090 [Flavobacteriaceae bacterium]|nr:hypothetical protein [Flavobacteriaceae bacterium]
MSVTRKDNQNKGREFYTCSSTSQVMRCGFFKWKQSDVEW